MGRDKALLVLPTGETMLQRALALMRVVAEQAMVVGSPEIYVKHAPGVRIIQDAYPGRGPLGGIHAALCASETVLNLILGVDCPRLTPELLRFLLRVAAGTPQLVTVPRVGGRLQNVCAVYRKEFAQLAEPRLLASPASTDAADPVAFGSRRRTRVDLLIAEAPNRIVEEDELRAAGFGPELFVNVNTPEEFEALCQGFERR